MRDLLGDQLKKECPADFDERSELYCLARLTLNEASSLESHLRICPACRLELDDTRAFLACLREALEDEEK